MGREKGKGRGLSAGRKTWPGNPLEWDSGRGAQGLRSGRKSRGDCQGVGGGVDSPKGTDTPGVEELPWGDETSGVSPEGDGVLGLDSRG